MKKLKLFRTLVLVLLTGLVLSCNSDDDTAQNPITDNGSVTATVNGVPLTFSSISAETTGPLLSVMAISADLQHFVQITMPKDIAPGTYPTYTNGMEGTFIRYNHQSDYFESETGTVTITSNDGQWINGSFQFEGITSDGEPGVLTEGVLHVRYE